MSILHTVNKSPFEKNTLESCLNHAREGDAVLLIEDGVYGAVKGTKVAEVITAKNGDIRVYVLGPDLAARGCDRSEWQPGGGGQFDRVGLW